MNILQESKQDIIEWGRRKEPKPERLPEIKNLLSRWINPENLKKLINGYNNHPDSVNDGLNHKSLYDIAEKCALEEANKLYKDHYSLEYQTAVMEITLKYYICMVTP